MRTRTKRTTTRKAKTSPAPFALSLGANLGDAEATLAAALHRLAEALGPLRIAPLYRTAPISPTPQPPFLNTAAVGATDLPPDGILALAKALELAAGRTRDPGEPRFGPRPLDVDLLLHGTAVRDDPELTLPHPRLRQRRFVLQPLAAIAPELRVPPDERTVAELLAELDDPHEVEELPWSSELGVWS